MTATTDAKAIAWMILMDEIKPVTAKAKEALAACRAFNSEAEFLKVGCYEAVQLDWDFLVMSLEEACMDE